MPAPAKRSPLTGVGAGLTPYELARAERIMMIEKSMDQFNVHKAVRDLQVVVDTEQAAKRAAKKPPTRREARKHGNVAGPRRASGRIAGQEAVTYNENKLFIDEYSKRENNPRRAPLAGRFEDEGCRPEVYTAAHVEALGSSQAEWELFVDGFDPNTGKRVYDPVNGITCHQCRQKTVGKRTNCSSCQSLHGQFCGDCLWMRYGENIDEALQNEEWVCPTCRDICNCSIHRTRSGWAPTGTMYRSVLAEGYSSVAHFVVLNKLDASTIRRVLAGELQVSGGYPESWATAAKESLENVPDAAPPSKDAGQDAPADKSPTKEALAPSATQLDKPTKRDTPPPLPMRKRTRSTCDAEEVVDKAAAENVDATQDNAVLRPSKVLKDAPAIVRKVTRSMAVAGNQTLLTATMSIRSGRASRK